MGASQNLLLASLPDDQFAALEPHLRTVNLPQGEVLQEAGEKIERVYFPLAGVVSLVLELQEGGSAEIAMVGRDSVVAGGAALGSGVAVNKAIMQIAGSGSVCDVGRLEALADKSKELRAILFRHEQTALVQAQQSAICNASHVLTERLARWLLRARDLTGSNDLRFTQEFIAQMLGTRRTSVSMVASAFAEAGIISYTRGFVTILKVDQLQDSACECYFDAKAHMDRLLGASQPHAGVPHLHAVRTEPSQSA